MTAERAVDRWAAQRRPMPADFRERARTMSLSQLYKHYEAGHSTVARWVREANILRNPRPPRTVRMPADFAEHARGLTISQAATMFNCHTSTARRWFVLVGIVPKDTRHVVHRPVMRAELDATTAGRAAQYLRRFYPNVHRADLRLTEGSKRTWGDEKGLPDGGRGFFYVTGPGVIPEHEMIMLARDHGFEVEP